MKIILDFTNFENNNCYMSTLHGQEVNSKTIGIITRVIATEAIRTSTEIDNLKAEIKDLTKTNSGLLRLNSELRSKVIELETEIKNQKKILDVYVNRDPSSKILSKNSTSDNSKLESGGNMKVGDDIISGNQKVEITHNYFSQPPQKPDHKFIEKFSNFKTKIVKNMALIETATKYILDLLLQNEELKKFPKEFTDEAVKWVKSWFLIPEDPKSTAKLEDPTKPMEVKKDIIQDKLAELKDNAQFQKELTERLAAFEEQRARLKNVAIDADIDAAGHVHIGDKGSPSGEHYTEKNIIKGGTIKAGGDFRLGDDDL